MEKLFKRYDVQLVEESENNYISEKIANIQVNSSKIVKKIIEVFNLDKKAEEYMILLCLDTKNYINGAFYISFGQINCTFFNIAKILKRTLLCNSNKIIIAHNHPSGNSKPSKQDYIMTENLEKAAELLKIELLDHIVIGKDNYTSIMNEREKT